MEAKSNIVLNTKAYLGQNDYALLPTYSKTSDLMDKRRRTHWSLITSLPLALKPINQLEFRFNPL